MILIILHNINNILQILNCNIIKIFSHLIKMNIIMRKNSNCIQIINNMKILIILNKNLIFIKMSINNQIM